MVPEIETKINNYIDTDGKKQISDLVNKKIYETENKTIADISNNIQNNINLSELIMPIYENIIINKLPSLLETIDISKIVSNKISEMPTLELEKLILEIMKKELNALVNLGALIGFILGLLNLLF